MVGNLEMIGGIIVSKQHLLSCVFIFGECYIS